MQYKRDAANLSLELAAVRRQRAVSECYLHWAMILWMKTGTDSTGFDSLEKVVQIKITCAGSVKRLSFSDRV